MKIAVLSAAKSIHTVKIVNSLSERGHEVRLYSLPDHKDKDNAISDKVEIVYLPNGGQKGYITNKSFLKKSLNGWNPDVLNAHYASGYGTLAACINFHPMVLSVWGSDVYDFPYKNFLCKWLIERNIKKADALCSTSNIMAERTKKFIKGQKDIYITPFGVNTNAFSPASVSHEELIVGFVKGVSEKYGIEYLVKAFAKVKSLINNDSVKLYVYGDGDLLLQMKQLAKDLKIEESTRFFGRIPHEEVPQAIQGMDIFCVPSTLDSESFGVAAVEAMSCEVPVIVSDVDGLKEVVSDGETGFIIHRRNEKELADKLIELINNKDLRINLGKAGRKRVLELYDWNDNIIELENAFIKTIK